MEVTSSLTSQFYFEYILNGRVAGSKNYLYFIVSCLSFLFFLSKNKHFYFSSISRNNEQTLEVLEK